MTKREPIEFIDTLAGVHRRISALAVQAYSSIELGPMQARLLRYVGKNAPTSQAELARMTDSDPALAGRVLGALIERGLIVRERSEQDRREYVLELSASGRRTHKRIEKLRSKLAARVVRSLSKRDLDDFERIAAKLLGTVD